MVATPLRSVRTSLSILLLAVVTAACTTAVAGPVPPPLETASPTAGSEPAAPAPTASPGSPITVDFSPDAPAVTLDNGWTVQHCEGDAPFLCVRDKTGSVLGTVEFASYPASDAVAQAVAEGAVPSLLTAMVEDQHEAISADRAEGCGGSYEYRGEPVRPAAIGSEPAAVYAFSGWVDGREIERHRSYYTVHAGQVWVLNAPASDPEGCMASDLGEFLPADLATFEPYLERIVAGSQLPDAGDALTDGIVVGADGGLDGGLLYVLSNGGKHRIQQPAALTENDVRALGLTPGPAIARISVVDGNTGSRFVVVPPDGPDARLQLIADGVIREILVQHVDPVVLAGVPDLSENPLGRLRPAVSASG